MKYPPHSTQVRLLVLALLLAALLPAHHGAPAGVVSAAPDHNGVFDWRVAQGGNSARNGQSANFGPTHRTLVWSVPTGPNPNFSFDPIIEDDLVVTQRDLRPYSSPLNHARIVALDLTSGAVRWEAELPIAFPATETSSYPIAIRDGRVYAARIVNSQPSYLYALSALDGSLLWCSQALMSETNIAFASDGDPVLGDLNARLRISKEDGTSVWKLADNTCPGSDSCGFAVKDDRGYRLGIGPGGDFVSVVDLASGALLYSSSPATTRYAGQHTPFVAPDGTVYAPFFNWEPGSGELVAFADTGTALVERWSAPLGISPLANFGVGPDGSVYSYSADKRLLWLHHLHH